MPHIQKCWCLFTFPSQQLCWAVQTQQGRGSEQRLQLASPSASCSIHFISFVNMKCRRPYNNTLALSKRSPIHHSQAQIPRLLHAAVLLFSPM